MITESQINRLFFITQTLRRNGRSGIVYESTMESNKPRFELWVLENGSLEIRVRDEHGGYETLPPRFHTVDGAVEYINTFLDETKSDTFTT